MESDRSRDLKMAASEAFAWAMWTEVGVLAILFLIHPLLMPYLYGIDFTRETLLIVVSSTVFVFCAFWLEGVLKALDRSA